ncbi:MAG: SAM-dependent methyltransferase, partial [Burkholderiales bacterium]|nr:SAM-dependent methyltransferase [Burkholderiales bacterium]
MSLALYEPGLGYYAGGRRKFGQMPSEGSDFVTAPEMSPLFGRALARQLKQAMDASGCRDVVEFGAGSGALAAQLIAELDALGAGLARYRIVELSAELRERQRERLSHWQGRVDWLDALPAELEAVVIGNEVLDAMPVQLLAFDGQLWRERGVVSAGAGFAFEDRDTMLRPPLEAGL